jgi:hypothetical protein
MKRLLPLLLVLFASPAFPPSPALPQSVAIDGEWRGKSNGGSCNAPLEYVLFIESGIVDGTASDATARGPVPNPKKTAPPPPTPGLWQIHGLAKPGSFSLMAVASVKGTDRRAEKLNVSSQGGALTVTENGGCGRTARLAKN